MDGSGCVHSFTTLPTRTPREPPKDVLYQVLQANLDDFLATVDMAQRRAPNRTACDDNARDGTTELLQEVLRRENMMGLVSFLEELRRLARS